MPIPIPDFMILPLAVVGGLVSVGAISGGFLLKRGVLRMPGKGKKPKAVPQPDND